MCGHYVPAKPASTMPLSIDCKRLILRHTLAVLLGTSAIVAMNAHISTSFDKIAAVSLFTAIVAVAGEDVSLGPVIHKAANRISGVCVGGFLGFVCLFFPALVFPDHKQVCLVVVPTLYVGLVQWATKGGWQRVSNTVKSRKGGHFVIQLQAAFGVVYIGSWDATEVEFIVAASRTVAITVGCVSLFLASLLAYPKTSLQVSGAELASVVKDYGVLGKTIFNGVAEGVQLQPMDHVSKHFDPAAKSTDPHVALLLKMDNALARIATLRQFLGVEVAWVPGLSTRLLGKETLLRTFWVPFLAVCTSRVSRNRSTLLVLDSNMRLSNDIAKRKFKEGIAGNMSLIANLLTAGTELVAEFLESPFQSTSDWKGAIYLKPKMESCLEDIKTEIEIFVTTVVNEVEKTNTVGESSSEYYMDAVNNHSPAPSLSAEGAWEAGGGGRGRDNTVGGGGCGGRTSSSSSNEKKTKKSSWEFDSLLRKLAPMPVRDRLGNNTMDFWHQIFPMRTFCTLTVQSMIQTSSLLVEVLRFISTLEEYELHGSDSYHRLSAAVSAPTSDVLHIDGGADDDDDQEGSMKDTMIGVV
jgi:hypothetical protein